MKEDVKKKHFSIPLRATSVVTCIQARFVLREDFWF
jgi:hypothetical protein